MPKRLLLVLVAALACSSAASAYPWPVKPFDRQHPIRGFFGDPRTVYLDGAFEGASSLSFHQGVDVSAPDGTPVYAVADGTIHYLGAATLNLVTDHDVTFQYFHLIPIAGEGQRVRARRTILGYVQPPFGHVHLTEIDEGRAVNPLQPGHLTPYRDRTVPRVREVLVRDPAGAAEAPDSVCGRVQLVADAYDTQPLAVPGTYRGLPISPALVQWSLRRAATGKAVVPLRTAADFRETLPANRRFGDVYAKGTYENSPRFGREQYPGMPGRYLFLLSRGFDTTRLPNGSYALTVRVADVRGNHSARTLRLSVANARPGGCAGTSTG